MIWLLVGAGIAAAVEGLPRRIAGGRVIVERGATSDRRTQLDDELVIAVVSTAIRSGSPLLVALSVAAQQIAGAEGEALAGFLARVRAGSSWEAASSPVDGVPRRLLDALSGSWNHGANAQAALQSLSTRVREEQAARSAQAAARLSVLLVIPLGACFLPAFVFLGMAPLALGLWNGGAG
ncbi:type II secretion system F family protein [Rarobacter incanus]|uniref:Type II secretion system (T2SS) protein F n=1 Tax=Rarobacter incanus TaxID=153494 RepID=A0A542SP77_9MICO|nr:type II secretion system F family protein [Rarobacter incanus]TQK76419.1 type II secretion system (T2SS) protein F [Rarobacter incanus]